MKIPFFDYKYLYKKKGKQLTQIFKKVCSGGKFILQNELKEFEDKISDYTRSKYSIGVGNATDALTLLIKSYNIKKNSEIIISSHTMIATAEAVYHNGLKPIPTEFGYDGLIDVNNIENKITKNTKGIIVTHLNGRVCDMKKILQICKKYKLLLFEDAAQALGAKYFEKYAGTFGNGGVISFYPSKVLGGLGDGGMILVNNKLNYNKLVSMRNHGRDKFNKIKEWGYNSRLDNMQASFLNILFKDHDKNINYRRTLADYYFKYIKQNENIVLPPNPKNDLKNYDIFQNFEVRVNYRKELIKYLSLNKIGTLIQWSGVSINNIPNLNLKIKLKSDYDFKKLLMLPMNLSLKKNDIIKISNCINKFYETK